MLKQKRILCLGLCISLLLGGCGGKKVQYDTVSEESSESDNEEKGKALKKELGIKEKKWKESISTEGEKQYINALIDVPNVSELMTMDVKEHYYTNEEKKELLEYFMEPESIEVNQDAAETKEVLQEERKILQESINSEKKANRQDSAYLKGLETELIRVEESLKHAGSKKELSQDVGDYEADDYYGKKGEMEYYLLFQMNPEYNISKWKLAGRKQQSDTQDKWWYFNMLDAHSYSVADKKVESSREKEKNTCSFSAGEAIKRAKKICSDLHLGNMQPYFIHGYAEDWDKPEEYNGYIIELSRAIGEYYVKPVRYYYTDNSSTAYRQNYGTEKVLIIMTDAGITYMSYEGCMATGTEEKVENLLGMDKVQEVIREEMKKQPFQTKNTYRGLYLEYIRVKGEEPDSYSIIPVWRLSINGGDMVSEEQYDDQEGNTQTCYRTEYGEIYDGYEVILINAIDGKWIDLDEEQILERNVTYQEYKFFAIDNISN